MGNEMFAKFNSMFDVEGLKNDVASVGSNTGDFVDVPHGDYDVKVVKLELGATGEKSKNPGAPMAKVWFEVLTGDFKGQKIFMNQMLTSGFGFVKMNEMLDSFETGIPVMFENFGQYDDLLKQYSKELGWDWRMLAAVVYQESKFSINSTSHRGATGLMQVMPSTAEYYGIDDLLDPEKNLKAGTRHLKRLQKMFEKSGMDQTEQIKFTLAAYNAGEGRIADCRRFAEAKAAEEVL